jgi:hypothetical protein
MILIPFTSCAGANFVVSFFHILLMNKGHFCFQSRACFKSNPYETMFGPFHQTDLHKAALIHRLAGIAIVIHALTQSGQPGIWSQRPLRSS